jgi:hypothetical protein
LTSAESTRKLFNRVQLVPGKLCVSGTKCTLRYRSWLTFVLQIGTALMEYRFVKFEFAVNFVILPVPVFERDSGTKVININTRIGALADMYL